MAKRTKKAKVEDFGILDEAMPAGLVFETFTEDLMGAEVTGRMNTTGARKLMGLPVDEGREHEGTLYDLGSSDEEMDRFVRSATEKVADLLGLRPADITISWPGPGPGTFPKVEIGFRLYGKHAPTEDALKKVRELMLGETDAFKKKMNRKAKIKRAAALLDEEKKQAVVRARLAAPAAKLSDANLTERLALRMAEKRASK